MYNKQIVIYIIFSWISICFSQSSPQYGQPAGHGLPMGPLPFPLFPRPCDMGCSSTGLIFANIAISNQPFRPSVPGSVVSGGSIAAQQPGVTARPDLASLSGTATTRPPGIQSQGTSRPLIPSGAGELQSPNHNAQFTYYTNQWCTGWCRFFYQPLPPPFMTPPAPRPRPPLQSSFYNHNYPYFFFPWFGLWNI